MSEATSRLVEARAKAGQISDWERHRSRIMKLYINEGRPLREVREILERSYGFTATIRMYKVKIRHWGMTKNRKSQGMDRNLGRSRMEELENKVGELLDSSPVVESTNVSTPLVNQHLRRTHLSTTAKEPKSQPTQSESPLSASPEVSTSMPQRSLQSENDEPRVTEVRLPLSGSWLLPTAATRLGFECPESRVLATYAHSCNEMFLSGTTPIDNDEASDSRRKRRTLSVPDLKPSLETNTLACLFYMHNPQRYNPQNEDKELAKRYRTCAGPGWKSISRLRQHLLRAHLAPKRCESCHSALQPHDDLENHAQHCLDTEDVNQILMSDTISEEQWRHLKLKQLSSLTQEQNWIRMYRILFPRDSKIPSPYYESSASRWNDPTFAPPSLRDLDSLIDHLCSVLPQKIVDHLQGEQKRKQIEPPKEESIAGALALLDEVMGIARISPGERSNKPADSTHQHDSNSAKTLKVQVSKAVTETCMEWRRSRMDEGNGSNEGSDEEESEDGYTASIVPDEQSLSLTSLTPPSNQSFRYDNNFTGDMASTSLGHGHGESGYLSSRLHQSIPAYPPSGLAVSQTGILHGDLNPSHDFNSPLAFDNMSPDFPILSDYNRYPLSSLPYQYEVVPDSTVSQFMDTSAQTAGLPNSELSASYKLPALPFVDMPPTSAFYLPTPDVSPEGWGSTG